MTSLTIARIGTDGDGVATGSDGLPIYVPFTLPGEIIEASVSGERGTLDAIEQPSADRVVPPCPHFGRCGGCMLQHWAAAPTAAWKAGGLSHALTRAGFPCEVAPPALAASHSRRRMDLAIFKRADGITIGLHAVGQPGEIVDMRTCLVLHPTLFALVAPLRALLPTLAAFRRDGSAVANLLDTGPDLLLRLDGTPDAGDRARLVAFAQTQKLPRIMTAPLRGGVPEIACLLGPATVDLSGILVAPPPGAFLQATAEGEAAIVAAVLAGLPKLRGKARIVELFAGVGTLTMALAKHARVLAFEGDPATHAALSSAVRRPPLSGRVEPALRDLARQPLRANELSGAAVIVLDPPHTGAAAQMPAIAASGVARVIYVSCNPVTLGRDASVLRAGGYRLLSTVAIDQFPWSARVESVSVFARG